MIEPLRQDILYSIRTLAKNRTVTFMVVLIFALGVGANTAIFSVVNAVLLRPLPFNDPDQIVGLRETLPDEGSIPASYRSFAEWRDRVTAFSSLACMTKWNPNLESGSEPLRVSGMAVSASYFDVMGLRPVLGRTFVPGEDRVGSNRVVILSHELWQRQFGSDPSILDKPVKIDGKSFTVVGVMPPAVSNPEIGWQDLWTQYLVDDQKARLNPGRYLRINGRLKPGVTLDQARAQVESTMTLMRRDFPQTHGKNYGVDIRPLVDFVVPARTRTALLILLGVVGCVLLIACTNISNLLLARAVGREREMAIRAALGATRTRLIRQLLAESLIVSLLSAAAGLLLAKVGLQVLLSLNAGAIPRSEQIHLDGAVLAFTLLIALLAGLIFGLTPALVTTKVDLHDLVKEGGRGGGQGIRHRRLRGILVIGEVAVALTLLIASGLMVRSYWRLTNIEPGFNMDDVLTMQLNLPVISYPENSDVVNFYRQLSTRVASLPGVNSVSLSQSLPLRGPVYTDPVFVEGEPVPPEGQEPYIRQNIVTTDFFKSMGISILKGRSFTEQETWETGGALIVNEAFVRRFFPTQDPLGKRIKMSSDGQWVSIVGVVANTVQSNFESEPIPEMYYTYINSVSEPMAALSLIVHTKTEPMTVAGSIRNELKGIDPTLPLSNVMTMRSIADNVLAKPRLNLLLIGIFAVLALILAVVGIYSVMSYVASQRTREIGVRMALGAQSHQVFWLIIWQGMSLVLVGLVVGMAGALLLSRLMATLLYGVTVTDPLTLLSAPLLLAAIALFACYFPARKAMRLDPVDALRYE